MKDFIGPCVLRWLSALLIFLSAAGVECSASPPLGTARPPDRLASGTVVLTFDDAPKSHLTVVAPLLQELHFQATFFITARFMQDETNFLTWEEVAKLHRMGFEIGNHSWSHVNFGDATNGARLGEELVQVETALAAVGVPKPTSFAWCGNLFGPEAIEQLRQHGYTLARRGMQPEVPYGAVAVGPTLQFDKHHPLLIPTTADANPNWTFEHFKAVLASAEPGKVIVLQFHGVPDVAHPWVNTPPDNFRQYMLYLKEQHFQVIALRDLAKYYAAQVPPHDPLLSKRLSLDGTTMVLTDRQMER